MYINDVIRLAQNFCPSEYSTDEMYLWCDEVSAMLDAEKNQRYDEVAVSIEKDGSVLLPEDVNFENIAFVSGDDVVLKKENFSQYGYNRMRIKGQPERIWKRDAKPSVLRVVYEKPFEALRLVKYVGEADFAKDGFTVSKKLFKVGDVVTVKQKTSAETKEFVEIPILAVTQNEKNRGEYVNKVSETDGAKWETGTHNCEITRFVTDKTLCPPPYDSMYVSYILAKISLYQHDSVQYSNHMAMFSELFSAYKKRLVGRVPCVKRSFENWW